MYCDEYDIWIFHGKINGLFRYSIKDKNTWCECVIENESIVQESMCSALYKIGKYIYMVPTWGTTIHCFDTITHTQKALILQAEKEFMNKMMFCGSYISEGKICFWPSYYRYYIEIDPKNDQIAYALDVRSVLSSKGLKDAGISSILKDDNNTVLAVIVNSNKIIRFDVKKQQATVIEIESKEWVIGSICKLNNDIYYTAHNAQGIWRIKRLHDEGEVGEYDEPIKITALDNMLLVDSVNSDWIRIIDCKGNIVHFLRMEKVDLGFLNYGYDQGVFDSHSGYYFSRKDYSLWSFSSREDLNIRCEKTKLFSDYDIFPLLDENRLINESDFLGLDDLLGYI